MAVSVPAPPIRAMRAMGLTAAVIRLSLRSTPGPARLALRQGCRDPLACVVAAEQPRELGRLDVDAVAEWLVEPVVHRALDRPHRERRLGGEVLGERLGSSAQVG